MDNLNQSSRTGQHGSASETSYNKPLQQPVRPVRPGQNGGQQSQNRAYNHSNIVRPQMNQGQVQKQRPNQQMVNQQRHSPQMQQQIYQQQRQMQIGQQAQSQQVNRPQQRQVQHQQVQQQYQNIQRQQVNNNVQSIQNEENSSLARGRKMTRLQREAQGLPSKPIVQQQYIGNKALGNQTEYSLANNNANSFKVKKVKQEGMGYLLLPFSIMIFLAVLVLILLGDVVMSINELGINTTSLLGSNTITQEHFVNAAEKKGLLTETKELGDGITETKVYTEEYSYEINYITFESNEDTKAYYNYIIATADESESSISSSIVGQNSAESTLISNTYNGFMDITYVDNTIIIAIAYDSNKQTEVIEFMNSLGY